MANYVLAISTDVDKLHERSEEIAVTDLRMKPFKKVANIIKDIKDTLFDNPNLVALAAPQLNHPHRIFCIKFTGGDIRTFINPMITSTTGLHIAREVSPSLPDREFIVPRHDEITAIYQKPNGIPEENKFTGAVAEVFQHMIQLLDGVLISDIGLEIFEDFDKATQAEQEEIIKLYMESLQEITKALNEEIEQDEELQETKKAIDFMKGVATGEITLEEDDDVKKVYKEKFEEYKNKNPELFEEVETVEEEVVEPEELLEE